MDFTLMPVPTVRVRGRVVGIPGRGTMISLIPADHGWFGDPNRRPGGVDQDGNFEFRGITPGAYILAAQHHADKQVWMGRLPVIVGNSHVTGLQLTMVAGTELSGLVRVAGDTAIQPRNLRIMLEPIDSTAMVPGSPAALKDDGTFVVPRIFPDTYRVSVFGLPEDHYLRTIRFGGEDQPSRTITTGPGASSGLELVISPGAPAIEGYVRNQEGQPVTGARVVLVPDGGPPDPVTTRMIPTESDGRFRMGGLIPGAYKVYAWEDIQEGEQYDPDLLKKYESSAKSVRLAERAQEVVDLLVIPSTARQGN
jgi:hypothetical protein